MDDAVTRLLGNIGKDPVLKTFGEGDEADTIATFNLATNRYYIDRKSDERKKVTHWHRVVVKRDDLVQFTSQYLKKGSRIQVIGRPEPRKYEDKDGKDVFIHEVVLADGAAKLQALGKSQNGNGASTEDVPAE